jgi:hypothetical protein
LSGGGSGSGSGSFAGAAAGSFDGTHHAGAKRAVASSQPPAAVFALAAELEAALSAHHGGGPPPEALGIKRKTFAAALIQIMIADVTMSLDNVLAVAGAAHEHPWIMVFGLVLSIGLMGVAATFIAKLLTKHRWIGYVGLVIVLYVAVHMIWDGARSVIVRTERMEAFNASAPAFLDISEEEKAKFLKGVESKDAPPAAAATHPAESATAASPA